MDAYDLIDNVSELDCILKETELAILQQNRTLALHKLRYARELIDDLRQEDCNIDSFEIEMHIMRILK